MAPTQVIFFLVYFNLQINLNGNGWVPTAFHPIAWHCIAFHCMLLVGFHIAVEVLPGVVVFLSPTLLGVLLCGLLERGNAIGALVVPLILANLDPRLRVRSEALLLLRFPLLGKFLDEDLELGGDEAQDGLLQLRLEWVPLLECEPGFGRVVVHCDLVLHLPAEVPLVRSARDEAGEVDLELVVEACQLLPLADVRPGVALDAFDLESDIDVEVLVVVMHYDVAFRPGLVEQFLHALLPPSVVVPLLVVPTIRIPRTPVSILLSNLTTNTPSPAQQQKRKRNAMGNKSGSTEREQATERKRRALQMIECMHM
mmetsp:Transcript_15661/g.39931  ORF Transcript_15661/g.39931 Transcript_15661/m.39931 type:complete len:312 (-) Transcript_15661:39-974(-)